MSFIIEEWQPRRSNTLRGFVRVRLPSGMIIHDVSVHQRDEQVWVSPPGRPAVGADGTQLRGKDGKARFSPTITFADRATHNAFSDAVLTALRAAHPEALQ